AALVAGKGGAGLDVGPGDGESEVTGRLAAAVVVDDMLLDDVGGGLVVAGVGAGLGRAVGDGAGAVGAQALGVAADRGLVHAVGLRVALPSCAALVAGKGGAGLDVGPGDGEGEVAGRLAAAVVVDDVLLY